MLCLNSSLRNVISCRPIGVVIRSMSSIFDVVKQGPPVEVFALTRAYNEDKHEKKTNLGVGAYRDENGKPWVLPVVRKTEIKITGDTWIDHEYLPVCGTDKFTNIATTLLLGEDSPAIVEKRAFGVQSLSGTGALRLGADFLAKKIGKKIFYHSEPTWENHPAVFLDAGFKSANPYTYWDNEARALDFCGCLDDLNKAPAGAVVIMHACAHNPTGMDPTQEQWKELAELLKKKKLFPFFDIAYQGFASGNPDRDAWAVRYFVEQGFELVAAQSFAKNFGLYCERVGNLTIVQNSGKTKAAAHSQFTLLIRANYSNPPAFGSRIVAMILDDPGLKSEWMDCIKVMSTRIRKMRKMLRDNLVKLDTPGTWDHITNQIGLFSYTGLTEPQVKVLIKDFHIYLLRTGRINMCGLNEKNVAYVAKSMHSAITQGKSEAKCKCS